MTKFRGGTEIAAKGRRREIVSEDRKININ